MMTKMIPMLLSMHLMVMGVASAKSVNDVGTNGHVETSGSSYFISRDESAIGKADLIGEAEIFYDDEAAVDTIDDQIDGSGLSVYQLEEIYYNDRNCSVCETVMSPIDDTTYEVCTPDGEVLGILHLDTDEGSATPYGLLFDTNWTVSSGSVGHTNLVVDAYSGTTISFNVKSDKTGSSRFGLYSYSDDKFYSITETWTDNAGGSFTLSKTYTDVTPAIWNMSDYSNTYTGWCII